MVRKDMSGKHGLRKYCKSKAEQVMKPINVFLILDYDSGILESYYRPTFPSTIYCNVLKIGLVAILVNSIVGCTLNKTFKVSTSIYRLFSSCPITL